MSRIGNIEAVTANELLPMLKWSCLKYTGLNLRDVYRHLLATTFAIEHLAFLPSHPSGDISMQWCKPALPIQI